MPPLPLSAQKAVYAVYVRCTWLWLSYSTYNKTRCLLCVAVHSSHTALSLCCVAPFRCTCNSPIAQCELRHLKCSVSLLVDYEDAEDVHDWEVSEHGIIITFKDTRGSQYSATYLPEVARDQGWTKAEALESLIRKSGYAGPVTTTLLQRATLTRYRSRKCSLHHAVYAAMERPSAR
eukprot:TRINITY_DN980_c0_g1_i3.p2 TRINITY_DN980_c0_g1~~TRINITY_DN980_c0_g1_i3.p2  ORF type:complete len:177 (-),score=43.56 TRINITY_DN980_c0_g1_i3:810-1340(-)